jgi:hypothetical protein
MFCYKVPTFIFFILQKYKESNLRAKDTAENKRPRGHITRLSHIGPIFKDFPYIIDFNKLDSAQHVRKLSVKSELFWLSGS